MGWPHGDCIDIALTHNALPVDSALKKCPMSPSDVPADAVPAPRKPTRRVARKSVLPERSNVTSDRAALSRKIGAGCEVALPTLGDDAVLRLQLTDKTASDFADPVLLIAQAGTIELADGARLLRALTGIDLGMETDDDAARWSWLQAALIGRLGNTPFSTTDRITRTERLDAAASVVMQLKIATPQHAFSLMARAEAATWLALLARGRWKTDHRPVDDYLAIPCRTIIRIAQHSMPVNALRAVDAGDIFLPDSPRFLTNGEGSVRLGNRILRVSYVAPCALKITALEGDVEQDDTDAHNVPEHVKSLAIGLDGGDHGSVVALNAMPVMLDFTMGQLVLSLGEIRRLHVGTILEIAGGSPSAIAIMAHGCAVGQGEVVDVNGQLGVRVTQWGVAP